MGDQDDRDPLLLVQLPNLAQDLDAGLRIEVPGRFIREQDAGPADKGARERNPLLLAARELGRRVFEPVAEAETLEQLDAAPAGLGLGHRLGGVGERHDHVVERTRSRQQIEALEHESDPLVADAAALVGRHVRDLTTLEPVLARARMVETAQDIHQRTLARSRDSHDGEQLAATDPKIDSA